jgi:hypothetical protein
VNASGRPFLTDARRKLLIRYGLPVVGGALVAALTSFLFWIIQSYLV